MVLCYTVHMLKLLFDPDTGLDDDAKRLVRKYDENRRLPRLGAVSRAVTPSLCDDCGDTYWSQIDTWVPHLDCQKGAPKGKAGFGG